MAGPRETPRRPGFGRHGRFTYDRWRALDARAAQAPVVNAAQIRDHLDTVRFAFPAPGVRTLWQAIYDLDEATMDLSFFTGDHNGASRYSPPIRFDLTGESP